MNTIKLKYCLEDITARVPGLFPYIEFDENHVCTVHLSSDSDVGCYGKIACALTIPDTCPSFMDIIFSGTSYSYKTLMGVYYKYKDTYPEEPFIQFMEMGIGKFKIDANIDYDFCTLVPEYEYYANCARLYNEYTQIGLMCEKYRQMGEINCELECLVEKYNRMGGDTMRDYYGSLVDKANGFSKKYREYASDNFELCFDMNVTSSENDLGILNTFIQFFGTKQVTVLYAKRGTGVVSITQDGLSATEKYYLENTCVLEAVRGVDYFLPGDFVIYNDRTYVCEQPTFNGEWDGSRFNLVSEAYSSLTSDTLTATSNSQLNGFIGELKYTDESGTVRHPEGGTDWLWYYRIGRIGFSETVTDKFNNIEIQSGEVRNEDINQFEDHLMAYGDIITNITRDKTNNTITFEYVIGAHFKAKLLSIDSDDDGNEHYCYGEYEYDSDDLHGLKYSETYEYEDGGEIYNMEDDFFDYFVNHDKNGLVYNIQDSDLASIMVESRYTRAPFNISGRTSYGELLVNGNEITFPYIVSDYQTKIQLEKDSIVNPLTKFDYLNGVAYKPTVESNVHVSRGNAAAWERHMKLGEIKSFDDMTTYSNNGFFNLR